MPYKLKTGLRIVACLPEKFARSENSEHVDDGSPEPVIQCPTMPLVRGCDPRLRRPERYEERPSRVNTVSLAPSAARGYRCPPNGPFARWRARCAPPSLRSPRGERCAVG